jgi:hypothetical protein
MSTLNELAQRYSELTRQPVDRRWKESTLATKVAEAEEQKARHEAAEAERARKEQIAEQMRQSRIAARGDFADFGKNFRRSEREDYHRLARAVNWAQGVLEKHEEVTADLTERFAKDPAYAMSWGMEYFQHAADYAVAKDLKGMFEHGVDVQSMLNDFNRALRHKASYPSRSTSPTSNLVDQETLRALTKVVGYLDGSEYF